MIIGAAGASARDRAHLPITVTAEVSSRSISIGDRIQYTITVQADRGIEIEFPDIDGNIAEFTIRDSGSSDGGLFHSETHSHWYTLETFETGEFTLPALSIRYRSSGATAWNEIPTEPIEIEVKSVLDTDAGPASLKDIKEPMAYRGHTYLYVIAAAVLIILVAALLYYLKRRQRPVLSIVPSRPAHELALEALERLGSGQYLEQGDFRQYYYELSDIIRHYIENRFSLRAPEMTTEEFLHGLKDNGILLTAHKDLLREFLGHCDMVKFAKYRPQNREIESSYASAVRLVHETKESDTGVTQRE